MECEELEFLETVAAICSLDCLYGLGFKFFKQYLLCLYM